MLDIKLIRSNPDILKKALLKEKIVLMLIKF